MLSIVRKVNSKAKFFLQVPQKCMTKILKEKLMKIQISILNQLGIAKVASHFLIKNYREIIILMPLLEYFLITSLQEKMTYLCLKK